MLIGDSVDVVGILIVAPYILVKEVLAVNDML
jgi:hypothetical protein